MNKASNESVTPFRVRSNTGGPGFLLALVAIATDVEFMYAAVKCLACVLKSIAQIHKEMERMHGYQPLAMFF
ncbi:WD repeat and FYVE domain-containing 3 isoform X2 [Brachionus plicatilis]|uniref:WD repeat and FYVE domain-containing 3 isoform X2 n=1 Tax=Brachionus plicatilis TaxID=10195 RepID=A0A3M7RHK1_BRAPC|nr:WD repeat and FYVE domain-containing 3 isoform X2 [Brachionus plicatilis]